jgi:hypothetical protein
MKLFFVVVIEELQIFHDFMTKLFEEPVANHYHSLNVNKTNLLTRYKTACQILDRLDAATMLTKLQR